MGGHEPDPAPRRARRSRAPCSFDRALRDTDRDARAAYEARAAASAPAADAVIAEAAAEPEARAQAAA